MALWCNSLLWFCVVLGEAGVNLNGVNGVNGVNGMNVNGMNGVNGVDDVV